jgi:transcription elongation factor GreA
VWKTRSRFSLAHDALRAVPVEVVRRDTWTSESEAQSVRIAEAGPPDSVVDLGSVVVLEDLDDSTCEEYLLVISAESNPSEGRISVESPVGRAIRGHRKGERVDAHAPHHLVRHLRILDVHAGRPTL